MKNRFLTFIIGILIGAIIMTLVFLIFTKENQNIKNEKFPPSINGQMQRPNGNMGEPPEKPTGDMQIPPR